MENKNKKERINELSELLNKAREAYYDSGVEIISNFSYDKLSDELEKLEKEEGVVEERSPSNKVGFLKEGVKGKLQKKEHKYPQLSLNKTKSIEELKEFLEDEEGLLSWKLDGLTLVVTYENGVLKEAVTRGNGTIGEDVTNNAYTIENLPKKIDYKGNLILRGETLISYDDFNEINNKIEDIELKYKNPRNLCAGSLRQLDESVARERKMQIHIFGMVYSENKFTYHEEEIKFLKDLGFSFVESVKVRRDNINDAVLEFKEKIKTYDLPSDGLVLLVNNINAGKKRGVTIKYPKDAIAFKWKDEEAITTLRSIEWNTSRTGLINPVAIFDEVSLEGTIVKRASIHNISILEELELGVGDKIKVYKANMIIPQISENLTKSNNIVIPIKCPVCGGDTEIRKNNFSKALYCTNEKCETKKIKKYEHFVERDSMNIEGLSTSTLVKFIGAGFIHNYSDLYSLSRYKDRICEMEGFGEKSYNNIIKSIENSKKVKLHNFINSIGILGVGLSVSKDISKVVKNIEGFLNLDREKLLEIPNIGNIISENIIEYLKDNEKREEIEDLINILEIEEIKENFKNNSLLNGKTIVITGDVLMFKNRNELKEKIEEMGGKVSGSVSKKTFLLINNDSNSSSSKNKKARELDIDIISEKSFIEKYLQ